MRQPGTGLMSARMRRPALVAFAELAGWAAYQLDMFRCHAEQLETIAVQRAAALNLRAAGGIPAGFRPPALGRRRGSRSTPWRPRDRA